MHAISFYFHCEMKNERARGKMRDFKCQNLILWPFSIGRLLFDVYWLLKFHFISRRVCLMKCKKAFHFSRERHERNFKNLLGNFCALKFENFLVSNDERKRKRWGKMAEILFFLINNNFSLLFHHCAIIMLMITAMLSRLQVMNVRNWRKENSFVLLAEFSSFSLDDELVCQSMRINGGNGQVNSKFPLVFGFFNFPKIKFFFQFSNFFHFVKIFFQL